MQDMIDTTWVSSRQWSLVINGSLAPAASGATYPDMNPSTGAHICDVPDGSAADVERAVEGSLAAYREWRRRPLQERARIVRSLGNVLRQHREELAALDALDVGNAYKHMLHDVELGAQSFEFMADLAFGLGGETLPPNGTHLNYTRREPIGVAARIVAFNHPVMFAAQKVAAPLLAGNAVILKPSDSSPLSALRMGEIFIEHLPPGLLNVVVGRGTEVPRSLVRHPDVRRIGFIGSEPVGRSIQRDAADSGVKDVTLELGGKNAIIVCEDAHLDAAAAGVIKGMNFVGWQSQSCGSTSRLLVHEDVADQLVDAVRKQMEAIRIGSPLDPATDMGSLASEAQYNKVEGYVELAQSEGAVLAHGGKRPQGAQFEEGFFFEPTLFDKVDPSMRIANEEVFGPVLSVIRWSDDSEAISIANSVPYGLTGSVWTRDIARGHNIAHSLEAGYTWINDASTHFPGMPFGGYKGSGIGREESIDELLSYTLLKAVNVNLQ